MIITRFSKNSKTPNLSLLIIIETSLILNMLKFLKGKYDGVLAAESFT
jgi:hypothetical protein